VKFNYGQ